MRSTQHILAIGDIRWEHIDDLVCLGGSAATFAARIAALGRFVEFAGVVGPDVAGERALEILRSYGVQTRFVQSDSKLATSGSIVNVTPQGRPVYPSLIVGASGQLAEFPTFMNSVDEFDVLYFNSSSQSCLVSGTTLQKYLNTCPPSFKVYDILSLDNEVSLSALEAGLQVASIVHIPLIRGADICSILGLPLLEPSILCTVFPEKFGVSYCIVSDPFDGVYIGSVVGEQIKIPPHLSRVVDLVGWHEALLAGFVHHVLKGATLARCGTGGAYYADLVANERGALASLSSEQLSSVKEI